MIRPTMIKVPISVICKEGSFIITGVRPFFKYVDGKKTEQVSGYAYDSVSLDSYEKFSIKVEESKPVILQEEIEKSGGHVKAKAINFEGKFYRNQLGDYDFTSKADRIEVIK